MSDRPPIPPPPPPGARSFGQSEPGKPALRIIEAEATIQELEIKILQLDKALKEEQEKKMGDQALHDRLRETERQLSEERDRWMQQLQSQLKDRERTDQEREQHWQRRYRDLEKRSQDEKDDWLRLLRQKEEEIQHLRRLTETELEEMRDLIQQKDNQLQDVKLQSSQDRRSSEQAYVHQLQTAQQELENQRRDSANWKAQMALLQTQLTQTESQAQEDRLRWQTEVDRLEQELQDGRKRLETQLQSREEVLKLEFSRREQERSQHWDALLEQLRSEKENLRTQLLRRDEELSRFQLEAAQAKRDVEMERTRSQEQIEKVKRMVREETLKDVPGSLDTQIAAERERWENETLVATQKMKTELASAQELQKAYRSKLEVESARADQLAVNVSVLKEQQAVWEESKKLLDAQLRQAIEKQKQLEQALVDDRRGQEEDKRGLQAMITKWKQEAESRAQSLEQTHQQLTALQNQHDAQRQKIEKIARDAKDEIERMRSERDELRKSAQSNEGQNRRSHEAVEQLEQEVAKHLQTIATLQLEQAQLQRQLESNAQAGPASAALEAQFKAKEAEWQEAQTKARELMRKLQTDMDRMRADFAAKQAEWSKKESEWEQQKAEAPALNTEDVQKTLIQIRSQMQQAQALLAWIKPIPKP